MLWISKNGKGETGMIYYISLCSNYDKMYFFLYSGTYNTRAGDLLRYLNHELPQFSFDIVKEDNDASNISSWCLAVQPHSIDWDDALENEIQKLEERYEAETVIIDAATFFAEHEAEITEWALYQKKAIPRCYADLQQLKERLGLADTSEIVLKTLENESGVTRQCGDDAVIMIGVNGEPYDVERPSFDALYQPMAEDLGAAVTVKELAQGYTMLPKAVIKETGEEIPLLDYGILCMPKSLNPAYAMQIREGIYKVFRTEIAGTNQYFLGQRGAWLVVDKDSVMNVRIIDDSVFHKTYEKIV